MAIALRKPLEIEKIKIPNRLVAKTLEHLKSLLKPGISLEELSLEGERFIVRNGGRPAFKGLYGFHPLTQNGHGGLVRGRNLFSSHLSNPSLG